MNIPRLFFNSLLALYGWVPSLDSNQGLRYDAVADEL